ncbi:MAG: ComEC/Rec2 family competence protein [Actinomycetia bacterium]|nr:ComEC/Rec2 family competence protein [Actinomycetes bacterium]
MSASEPGRDKPVDLRLVPVAACVWAGCWGATSGPSWLVVTSIVAVVAMVGTLAAWRRGRCPAWAVACAVAALAAALIGGLAWWSTATGPLARWAGEGAVIEVQATVSGDPVTWAAHGVLPSQTVVPVRLRSAQARGETVRARVAAELVLRSDAPSLAVGQTIAVTAKASPGDPGSGLAVSLRQAGTLAITGEPGPLDRALTRLRQGLHDAMRLSPPQQAGLVPSVVVGDTSALPTGIVDQFRATNLSHIVAVSGTNLTLMLGFVLVIAKAAHVRGWWLRGVAILGVAWFVALCRAEPSVLRAAAMGLVGLVAAGAGGVSRRGPRQLSLAVCGLLLLSPWMSHSWGFALSALATGGIIWWAEPWQRIMSRWAPRVLAGGLCVSLAAQLATQPLVTALNGQVSLVGLFANLAAAPFVGPVTVLGLIACLVSTVSSAAAAGVGWLAGWCAQPILLIAQTGSGLPGATLPVGASAVALVVVAAVCLGLAQVVDRLLARPWACAAGATLLVVGVLVPTPTPGWPADWQVVFCDVGQGDAAVVSVGGGSGLVIDTGPEPAALRRCLDSLGIRQVPLLVLTHEHADHTGGLPGLAGRYAIGQVMVRAGLGADELARERAILPGVPFTSTVAGQRLSIGPATWSTIVSGPVFTLTDPGEGEDPGANNASTIGLVEVGDLRVLFSGDAEPAEQAAALAAAPGLSADVLKVPHHGSARQDTDFLAAGAATVAVISVGADNDYGHPAAGTVSALQRAGMRVWRTDERGAVAIARHGAEVVVRAQRAPP